MAKLHSTQDLRHLLPRREPGVRAPANVMPIHAEASGLCVCKQSCTEPAGIRRGRLRSKGLLALGRGRREGPNTHRCAVYGVRPGEGI